MKGKILASMIMTIILCQSLSAASIRVPFQLKRGVVIIPTTIKGAGPLELILDTGMTFDGVYLFSDKISKEIASSELIQVKVPGAGSGAPSKALMIENSTLSFGNVTVDSQRVIMSISEHTRGFPSDGVIGWSLFGHYIVGIDYDAGMITLYGDDFTEPDSSWQIIPITLKNNLPFLEGAMEVVEGETTDAVFYIDLASREALELLTGPDQKYRIPDSLKESYLGTGLSGDIYGSRGKCRHLWIGKNMLGDIPTAFAPAEVRSKQKGADGVLGNGSIRRFNIIFDYPHNRLFVKPNKNIAVAFEQNDIH